MSGSMPKPDPTRKYVYSEADYNIALAIYRNCLDDVRANEDTYSIEYLDAIEIYILATRNARNIAYTSCEAEHNSTDAACTNWKNQWDNILNDAISLRDKVKAHMEAAGS